MDVLYLKAHDAYGFYKRKAPEVKRSLFSCIRLGETSTDIVPFDIQKSTLLSDKLVEVPRELELESQSAARRAQQALKKDKVAMRHEQVIRKHLSTNMQPPTVIEWLEMRDPETGKVYYHNKVTGKSVWSKPEGFDEAMELSNMSDETRTTFWIEVQDSKGRVYYYDLLTRETRWDRPANYDDAYVEENQITRASDRPLSIVQAMKRRDLQMM
jgi:hypothetical protein